MEDALDTLVQVMSDLTPRDTFEYIQNLHHCDNEQLDGQLFKRGDQIHRTNLWFFPSKLMAVANDEQQTYSSGIWVLAEAYGYVVQFEPYQGM